MLDRQGLVLDAQAAHQRSIGSPHPHFGSMLDLIEGGDAALAALRSLVKAHDPADEVTLAGTGDLLAPIPLPPQMRDCLCFKEHIVNAIDRRNLIDGRAERTPEQHAKIDHFFSTRPYWYKCNRFAFVGPDTVVKWPPFSLRMDYELEVAVVIGKTGRNISKNDANTHIFGYTIFNDLSARDVQPDEMLALGPARSKDFDGANIIGPCIVTADAFDPINAKMTSRINGVVQGGGVMGSMQYSFADLIAFISMSETLHAGELLGSGTIGTGCGLETGRLLETGDIVELEVEGIGILRNQIVATHG
ncbi:hypothetical protein ASD39_19280 [Sphingomonas sp. Root50]|nr:hypothetical protein ASD17_15695 [Sphingomonas sp. Root1294]KQY72090.1 hypothetical protein ASD39_19280 [Sphingomonas sp. Root50]KRB94640.1 hypothetical protein ASE22_01475 [Sphingomonas sp. Root720]